MAFGIVAWPFEVIADSTFLSVTFDRVNFFMHSDGSVVLFPKRPASVLRGMVKARRGRASIEQMSEAAAAGAAADALPRSRR